MKKIQWKNESKTQRNLTISIFVLFVYQIKIKIKSFSSGFSFLKDNLKWSVLNRNMTLFRLLYGIVEHMKGNGGVSLVVAFIGLFLSVLFCS